MNGDDFRLLVQRAFQPPLEQLGFRLGNVEVNGLDYSVDFVRPAHRVLVSYEPGDDALFVYVMRRVNGGWSEIDDRESTPRLADIARQYGEAVSPDDRRRVNTAFSTIRAGDDEEGRLIAAAKELTLVLPPFLKADDRHPAPGA